MEVDDSPQVHQGLKGVQAADQKARLNVQRDQCLQ